MKVGIFVGILLMSQLTMAQNMMNQMVLDSVTGKQMLYGRVDDAGLRWGEFGSWFVPEFDQYQPEYNSLSAFAGMMPPNGEIIIVLGTWCPDSRREVPRMIKVLYSAGVYSNRIRMTGVDRNKQAEGCGVEDLGISRVPTLILMVEGEEWGRITETPETTIENDLMEMVTGR